MKKSSITIIALIVIMSIAITLFFFNNPITGKVIGVRDYTHTKAICDDENYCQDHIIKCSGEKVISITPITGAVVQFDKDWEDPRTKEQIEKLCD